MEKTARLTPFLSVSPQISASDIGILKAQGFPRHRLQPARRRGRRPAEKAARSRRRPRPTASTSATSRSCPARSRTRTSRRSPPRWAELRGPVLAFCRTGTALGDALGVERSGASRSRGGARDGTERGLRSVGHARAPRGALGGRTVGGGAGGETRQARSGTRVVELRPSSSSAAARPASRPRRASSSGARRSTSRSSSRASKHYYQPGWTLVGGGVFERAQTERPMARVMAKGVAWIRAAVSGFEPDKDQVVLEDGGRLGYRALIAAPGIKLDWDAVEGLRDALGKNGVTSNYRFEMAPYTWQLVQSVREGRAIFTQPPMPIKCAGAPQKAMYLVVRPLAAQRRAEGHRRRVRYRRRRAVRRQGLRSAADEVRREIRRGARLQQQSRRRRRRGQEGLGSTSRTATASPSGSRNRSR